MDRPTLKTAFVTRGHTRAIKEGALRPSEFDFAFEEVPVIIKAFRRMVRGLEFDVSEMAITTYVCARAHGKRFTAIPVFPMRAFHHGAIVYNVQSGISGPKDLEGRRVGVNRGYTVTTGVWARAILQHQYGVDLGRVTWVLSGDEHVAEYRPPANVVPIEPGPTLEERLISGDIAAAIGVSVDAPHVRRLIPDATEAGFAAFQARGLYPINHTIVVRDDVLAAHPGVAVELFRLFSEAKAAYLSRLKTGTFEMPADDDPFLRRMATLVEDPLPYGVAPNRAMLEALVAHAVEQGIIPAPVPIESLFAPGTLDLAG